MHEEDTIVYNLEFLTGFKKKKRKERFQRIIKIVIYLLIYKIKLN